MIKTQSTPFGTIHVTATGPAESEASLKGKSTRTAKGLGFPSQVTRRSHIIGDTVTVFSIFRSA